MPALSFGRRWIDDLLASIKQWTTRPETDRIKAGDIVSIYIEQRRRILDKPLRRMTAIGIDMMYERGYPMIPAFHQAAYPAHFLGKVMIREVVPFKPSAHKGHGWHLFREQWARQDGFSGFVAANEWFKRQYGTDWMQKPYTIIGWDGWLERYFSPGELTMVVGD